MIDYDIIDKCNAQALKTLIVSIFEQAILDALVIPKRKSLTYKHDVNNKINALYFLSKDNRAFQIYCDIMDLDPSYAEKLLLNRVQRRDLCARKFRREIRAI